MAARLHLDTHAVVWLHQGDLTKFTRRARATLESSVLLYAPILKLELHYLMEINRLRSSPGTILGDLRQEIGLEICGEPYIRVVDMGCQESWTRDPFDRLIVAQARISGCPLLTRDQRILENYSAAFW